MSHQPTRHHKLVTAIFARNMASIAGCRASWASQSFGHLQSELGEGRNCMQSWAVSQLQSELGEGRDFMQSWAVNTHQCGNPLMIIFYHCDHLHGAASRPFIHPRTERSGVLLLLAERSLLVSRNCRARGRGWAIPPDEGQREAIKQCRDQVIR